jgi:hypothetical protein
LEELKFGDGLDLAIVELGRAAAVGRSVNGGI